MPPEHHGRARVAGEAGRGRQQHQRRRVAARERAAAVHDQVAKMHQHAAEFSGKHDKPGKAARERDLAQPGRGRRGTGGVPAENAGDTLDGIGMAICFGPGEGTGAGTYRGCC